MPFKNPFSNNNAGPKKKSKDESKKKKKSAEADTVWVFFGNIKTELKFLNKNRFFA